MTNLGPLSDFESTDLGSLHGAIHRHPEDQFAESIKVLGDHRQMCGSVETLRDPSCPCLLAVAVQRDRGTADSTGSFRQRPLKLGRFIQPNEDIPKAGHHVFGMITGYPLVRNVAHGSIAP